MEAVLLDPDGSPTSLDPVPPVVLWQLPETVASEPLTRVRELTTHVLRMLQEWIADERYAASRLVIRTADAVSDPGVAAVQGLVRSAQSENPGRFVLVEGHGVIPAAFSRPVNPRSRCGQARFWCRVWSGWSPGLRPRPGTAKPAC